VVEGSLGGIDQGLHHEDREVGGFGHFEAFLFTGMVV
jgi:hypothetical protein